MFNSKVLRETSINGVTVTLSKRWDLAANESDCVYMLKRSDQQHSGLSYMEGEANRYFDMACDDIRYSMQHSA